MAAGLHVAGVYDTAELTAKIAEQDDGFLRIMLRHGAYVDSRFAAERNELLAGRGLKWREATLAHVTDVLKKWPAHSSFPYAMIHLTGYPLLKKSANLKDQAWRLAYLSAVRRGDLPPPSPATLAEIHARSSAIIFVRHCARTGSQKGPRLCGN